MYHLRHFRPDEGGRSKTENLKNNKTSALFTSSPLFKGSSPETVDYAVSHCEIFECKKGDSVPADGCSLYLILEGSASVCGKTKTYPVILNTLKAGRVFGMASLFGERCASTAIIAKENCIYARISQACVEEMMKSDIGFTKNYVCFLSDKIRFLNKKIAFFTSGSAEKKVAGYLLSLPMTDGTVKPDMNMSKLARHLDMGRASLYRALDSLEESSFISRENNVIKISSPEEFKKIYGESL